MLTQKTLDKLGFLYGAERVSQIAEKLLRLLQRYGNLSRPGSPEFLTAQDIFLITYADNLRAQDEAPLRTLNRFWRDRLGDFINIVHILPFFPYSSDDGFSVIDFRAVKPEHGTWEDIDRWAENVDFCFDLVLNHVSASSHYFRGFLAGDEKYQDFFIALDPATDTSGVLRPRTSPLLHRYKTTSGDKWCWTTFSADQLDLNYHNPEVLLEMLDILLGYVARGARILRLDAIAYLWKQLGTDCAHLLQTHAVVQLMRDVLDIAAPHVLLMTETNVPHAENVSYFGNGSNEAQIVYNFPLPPLVLFTLTTGSAAHLTRWARTLTTPSPRTTFLNFTASHDGIGVRPAADILSPDEFQLLVAITQKHSGRVSSKSDSSGNAIPYELNINYFDALNNPADERVPMKTQIDRFLLSQSIALVLRGMPAIYIHSLLGSRGWPAGVAQTGRARAINREKLDLKSLEQQLDDENSLRAVVFNRYQRMIRVRRSKSAFSPQAPQKVIDLGTEVFALLRTSGDGRQSILALHNVTGQLRRITVPAEVICTQMDRDMTGIDLLSGKRFTPDDQGLFCLELQPYEICWLNWSPQYGTEEAVPK